MRTPFSKMRLFNDTFSHTANIFYMQRKGVGVSKSEGEREREIVRGGVCVERVTTWVINVTVGQVFIRV